MIISIVILFLVSIVLYSLWGAKLGASIGVGSGEHAHQVQDLFFKTVFSLLGYVAKRDGPVNQKEVKRTEVYMEKMALDANQKREAIRLFKQGSSADFDADAVIEEFHGLGKKSPNLVQILLVYLISLARVDGLLGDKETEAVQKVAFGLGYSSVMFKHLLQMVSSQYNFSEGAKRQAHQADKLHEKTRQENAHAQSQAGKNNAEVTSETSDSCAKQTEDFNTRNDQLGAAYKVLDVHADVSDKGLKKAYRNLVSQYHPDKLMGQGLPAYMIQSATECFQTIQSAYQYIKDARAK